MGVKHRAASKKAWIARKKMRVARSVAHVSQATDSKTVETPVKIDLTDDADHKSGLRSSH